VTDIPAEVVRLVAIGDQRRADRADTAWRTLNPYERRIVREAAVMGYVLGRQDGLIKGRDGGSLAFDNGDDFPRDFDIVRQVLEHCDSTSDLYPHLGEAASGRRRRITRARMWPGEAVASR
jgi:hypothetical protein